MEMGKEIRRLRNERGLTQEALAAALNVTAQTVSKWECGTSIPDVQTLPEIAVYFGVTIDQLFAMTPEQQMERIENRIYTRGLFSEAEQRQLEQQLSAIAENPAYAGQAELTLAKLYNNQAEQYRLLAVEHGKEAVESLGNPDAVSELANAWGSYMPDWCVRNHHALIDWYGDYCRRHPESRSALLWLLDNLIDDGRFAEAEEAVESLAKIDGTFRTSLYRGLILWHQGKRSEAHAVWDKMLAEFDNDWLVWFSLGDVAAMELRYEDAAAMYRKGIEVQEHPRYVDGFESIAQICEVCGDYAAAIAALEEELEVLKTDWDTTKGETADSVRREIRRLKARQSKKA